MTFHTILHKSEQYIEALKRARQLTDDLDATINKGITDPDKQVSNDWDYSSQSYILFKAVCPQADAADVVKTCLDRPRTIFCIIFIMGTPGQFIILLKILLIMQLF